MPDRVTSREEEEWAEDHEILDEGPGVHDAHLLGDDGDPCPHCQWPVYELIGRCPHCGGDMENPPRTASQQLRGLLLIGVILAVCLGLLGWALLAWI
ncbi:MAG: hypothetical protein JJU36_00090 [Phycisphaeraceae bacterium]|nr:hypothetical protein [Phycisphaeraceae bacterium]